MSSYSSPWPRRLAVTYIAIVFAAWIIALLSPPFAPSAQEWVFVVGLPWSLLFLGGSSLFEPLGLVFLFLTGILNAGILYRVAGRWMAREADSTRQRLLEAEQYVDRHRGF